MYYKNMLGVHVFKPNSNRIVSVTDSWQNRKNQFGLTDYDIVIAYLSILNWKKHNGKMMLFTDAVGYDMFRELQMTDLYNHVDKRELEANKNEFDDSIFWAGCKLQAMRSLDKPFVIMDMDLYVEKNLDSEGFYMKDVGILHYEEKSALSYPSPFVMPGFETPIGWDWSSYPINTALLYFGNLDFKNEYVNTSLEYMKNSTGSYVMDQFHGRMIFAEQRLLGEMIDKCKIPYINIIDGLYYPGQNDNCYGFVDVMNVKTAIFNETEEGLHKHSNIKEVEHFVSHLWGFKAVLLNDSTRRWSFMNRLLFKFNRDFPNEYGMLKNSLECYYKNSVQ